MRRVYREYVIFSSGKAYVELSIYFNTEVRKSLVNKLLDWLGLFDTYILSVKSFEDGEEVSSCSIPCSNIARANKLYVEYLRMFKSLDKGVKIITSIVNSMNDEDEFGTTGES